MKRRKKIAFCFLIDEKIYNQKVWVSFFESLSCDFEIFCHYKEKKPELIFDVNYVDIIKTKWGDISLIHSTFNLFEKAFREHNCDFAYLLSGDTLPIKKNFKGFVESNQKTTFSEYIPIGKANIDWHKTQYNSVDTKVRYNILPYKHFKKANMFFCINRKDYIKINKNKMLDSFKNVPVPDEVFWINSCTCLDVDYKIDPNYIYCNPAMALQACVFKLGTDHYSPSILNSSGFHREVIGDDEISDLYDEISKCKLIRKIPFEMSYLDKLFL